VILCTAVNRADARAVTQSVCKPGEKLSPEAAGAHGWPEGTLDLVNHPLRHSGWRHFFNTEPADRVNFVFLPRSNRELKALVKQFAKIGGKNGMVILDPRPCQLHSFVIPIKEELNAAAVLNIGSQKILEHWYAGLPVDFQGNKLHNNAPLAAAPTAGAPTLTIFAGNEALDLDKMKLPKSVMVRAAVTDQHRTEHPDDPVVAKIDRLIARHVERGGKSFPALRPQPAPGSAEQKPAAASKTVRE
jgi:hypothetical protein